MNISRADLSDLQELAESFSHLGFTDLVNVKPHEVLPLHGTEEASGSNVIQGNPPDAQMREGGDFHTDGHPAFDSTRFATNTRRNPGRNPSRVPDATPWAKIMLQPLHPYGIVLNLDVIDFRNIEELIDEWVSSMKIAATTLDLDRENFIRLIELSLEGSVKIGWKTTLPRLKEQILEGESKSTIAERFGRLFKTNFIGDGYFEEQEAEKTKVYTEALLDLELRSICAVDEYIYWFRKYFFQSKMSLDAALPLFFAKICSPWREMLIQSYSVPPDTIDSVARRMSFLKDKLREWCQQASHQKNMKRLRGKIKRTPLCCDNNDFPTIIGESGEYRKARKKSKSSYNRSFRRPPFRRRRTWWSKNKARSYKSGQRMGTTRSSSQGSTSSGARTTGGTSSRRTFRRAHTRANESFKDCNCWKCGARGHISPDCPQNRGEIRKYEATEDILDAVYQGKLVPVYQFEDIPSDESVYEEELRSDSDSNSDGSSTESD